MTPDNQASNQDRPEPQVSPQAAAPDHAAPAPSIEASTPFTGLGLVGIVLPGCLAVQVLLAWFLLGPNPARLAALAVVTGAMLLGQFLWLSLGHIGWLAGSATSRLAALLLAAQFGLLAYLANRIIHVNVDGMPVLLAALWLVLACIVCIDIACDLTGAASRK